jgi:hypothetical protein
MAAFCSETISETPLRESSSIAVISSEENNVEVHRCVLVFRVVQIEHRHSLIDAGGNGGDEFPDREILQLALGEELVERDGHGHAAAGDRCGARAAVGLQDIAIDPHRALADLFQVHHGAQRAADEALDFGRASVDFPARDITWFAVERGVGQHRILGGEPAAFHLLGAHPARHVLLDRRGADHPRVAEGNEHRAGGVWCDVGNE